MKQYCSIRSFLSVVFPVSLFMSIDENLSYSFLKLHGAGLYFLLRFAVILESLVIHLVTEHCHIRFESMFGVLLTVLVVLFYLTLWMKNDQWRCAIKITSSCQGKSQWWSWCTNATSIKIQKNFKRQENLHISCPL